MVETREALKVKIARRVVEVLEHFSHGHECVTVSDITRGYGRPQSSTSELLYTLTQMGLLHRDARTRTFAPTPRLAILGAAAQPPLLRDGRLYAFMDRLAESRRLGVGLIGMVGVQAQVFRVVEQPDRGGGATAPCHGAAVSLAASAAGLLLLSTFGVEQARRILRRLNAEAAEDERFDHLERSRLVDRFASDGHAVGAAGFVSGLQLAAVPLPPQPRQGPMALAIFFRPATATDPDALVTALRCGIAEVASEKRASSPA